MRHLAALLALTATACSDTAGDKTTAPDGQSGSGEAPVVSVTAPDGTGTYYSDQPIDLVGTVSDAEDAPGDLTVLTRSRRPWMR